MIDVNRVLFPTEHNSDDVENDKTVSSQAKTRICRQSNLIGVGDSLASLTSRRQNYKAKTKKRRPQRRDGNSTAISVLAALDNRTGPNQRSRNAMRKKGTGSSANSLKQSLSNVATAKSKSSSTTNDGKSSHKSKKQTVKIASSLSTATSASGMGGLGAFVGIDKENNNWSKRKGDKQAFGDKARAEQSSEGGLAGFLGLSFVKPKTDRGQLQSSKAKTSSKSMEGSNESVKKARRTKSRKRGRRSSGRRRSKSRAKSKKHVSVESEENTGSNQTQPTASPISDEANDAASCFGGSDSAVENIEHMVHISPCTAHTTITKPTSPSKASLSTSSSETSNMSHANANANANLKASTNLKLSSTKSKQVAEIIQSNSKKRQSSRSSTSSLAPTLTQTIPDCDEVSNVSAHISTTPKSSTNSDEKGLRRSARIQRRKSIQSRLSPEGVANDDASKRLSGSESSPAQVKQNEPEAVPISLAYTDTTGRHQSSNWQKQSPSPSSQATQKVETTQAVNAGNFYMPVLANRNVEEGADPPGVKTRRLSSRYDPNSKVARPDPPEKIQSRRANTPVGGSMLPQSMKKRLEPSPSRKPNPPGRERVSIKSPTLATEQFVKSCSSVSSKEGNHESMHGENKAISPKESCEVTEHAPDQGQCKSAESLVHRSKRPKLMSRKETLFLRQQQQRNSESIKSKCEHFIEVFERNVEVCGSREVTSHAFSEHGRNSVSSPPRMFVSARTARLRRRSTKKLTNVAKPRCMEPSCLVMDLEVVGANEECSPRRRQSDGPEIAEETPSNECMIFSHLHGDPVTEDKGPPSQMTPESDKTRKSIDFSSIGTDGISHRRAMPSRGTRARRSLLDAVRKSFHSEESLSKWTAVQTTTDMLSEVRSPCKQSRRKVSSKSKKRKSIEAGDSTRKSSRKKSRLSEDSQTARCKIKPGRKSDASTSIVSKSQDEGEGTNQDQPEGSGGRRSMRRSGRHRVPTERFGIFAANDSSEKNSDCRCESPDVKQSKRSASKNKRLHAKRPPKNSSKASNAGPSESKKTNASRLSEMSAASSAPIEWNEEEVSLLHVARSKVDPLSSTFWSNVSNFVPNRTAIECQEKWFSLVKTPVTKSKRASKQQTNAATKSYASDEDDIFDATPMKELFPMSGLPPMDVSYLANLDFGSAIKAKPSRKSSPKSRRRNPGNKTYLQGIKREINRENATKKRKSKISFATNKRGVSDTVYGDGDTAMNGKLSPGGTLRLQNLGDSDADGSETADNDDSDDDEEDNTKEFAHNKFQGL